MYKLVLVILLSVVILTGCVASVNEGAVAVAEENRVDSEDEDLTKANYGFISAKDVVADMGTGWNLGNTLDSWDVKQYTSKYINLKKSDYQIMAVKYYETLWDNPVTTKEMIKKVAEAGFRSVRIPVTYYNHIDSQGMIDKAWLVREKEIVSYVLDNNMYCIINIHHDAGKGSWLRADLDTIKEQKANLETIWTQIAKYFKDYGEKLLFEGFNEILNTEDAWNNAGDDSYEAVNQLNQKFVDTVRSTGGNNTERNLIVNSYAAGNSEDILNAFVIPADSEKNHLIGEIHYYSKTVEDLDKIKIRLGRINKVFTDKGIPAIIGEFASENDWSEVDSIAYIKRFMTEAKVNNFAVYWWDRGGKHDTNTRQTETLLDRNNLTWYSEDLLKAVLLDEN